MEKESAKWFRLYTIYIQQHL